MFANDLDEKWLAFRRSVDELNAFRRPQVLRKYQADLLDSDSFALTSPLTGKEVLVTRSTMLADRGAYLIPDQARSWLVSGPTRFGFPLWELVTEADRKRWLLNSANAETSDISEREIQALNAFPPEADNVLGRGTTLLIGDAHFAHHLWNELAGLDEWLAHATDDAVANLAIVTRAEPLGPLEWTFPRLLPALSGQADPARQRRRLLAGARVVTKVGSCRVTSRLREQIKAVSDQRADPSATNRARQLLQNAWPRIWMSVRLESRTADNQEEFLLETIRRVFLAYPDAAVVFDGFSFPVGFFSDPRTMNLREEFTARSAAANAFIEHLREQIRARLGNSASSRLCSVSGLSLFDAINIGAYCEYYVCHAGTLQHKIAWIHNIPGLIHLPLNNEARAVWHAAQVEDGIVPDLMPAGLTIPTDPPASGRQRDRNFNYHFENVAKAADFVVSAMRARIGTSSPAR